MASERGKWPWWVWLVVILFPIPLHMGWQVTIIFIAAFLVLIWVIRRDFS